MHHVSIRTANIYRAIAFYELLGFSMEERFTADITLACWLSGPGGRLELLQIPEPQAPVDAFHNEHYVGYYHLSFDLTAHLEADQPLADWLDKFIPAVVAQGIGITVLLRPELQTIGNCTYEIAFITDADGLPIELLRQCPPSP
ncbi:VOC family protein [Lyngbya confervoides]|uniref:VOC family protein n=1 Tax=Lyngbya confervoides BDU141951 TaxID=1574623 RepID=A0ABD4T3P5_9CYAN|nr:VOC family protein [Lyngbya confervoides]MCM1983357.1 VOC family protein [Lyngbya confervoides BDU141951]